MKLLIVGSILMLTMSLCGLGDRLKGLSGSSGSNAPSNSSDKPNTGDTAMPDAETAKLTPEQKSIADDGKPVNWDEQGISWQVPANWQKLDVSKESLNYGTPADGFLIGTVSVMSASFPSEISIKATYQSALEQLQQGKYEAVRWLEIDGVKGVEWIEAMPEDKSGVRRQQWIAFRNYQGQNQQLNIMVTTKGSNFDKQRDVFASILYSMRIPKG